MWNFLSFPFSYTRGQLSDTEIRTLYTLWNAKTPLGETPVSILRQEPNQKHSLTSLIGTIYKTHTGSFADLGGILRDYSSEDVVKEIIELPIWEKTNTRGIVFFGKNNEMRVRIRGSKESIPFGESPLKKEELIAYWEQKFTRSADFKLSPNMTSIHTFSHHTKMRDLLQAVWRLRELDKGQKVQFLILEEDAEIMKESLKQAGISMENPKAPTLSDLFRFVKYNEIVQQKDHIWRALGFNLKSVLLNLLSKYIFDWWSPGTVDLIIDELFFHTKPSNAYDLYGDWQREYDAETAIDQEIAELKKSTAYQFLTQPVLTVKEEEAKENKEKIAKAWKEIKVKTLPHLAAKIQKSDHYNLEVQVEIDASMNTNTNVNTNVNTNIHQEMVQEISLPENTPERHVFLWKEEGLFEGKYFALSPKKEPNPRNFPQGSLALPDFEKIKQGAHSMDHLDVLGKDLLAEEGIRPVSRMHHLADPNLLESWNALPNEKSPFALIIQNRWTNRIQLMALSPWDALMFRRLFESDRNRPTSKNREINLALYHADLGIVDQPSVPIDKSYLENSKDFLRLKTQLKFFNGCVEYDNQELEILRSWASQKGSATLLSQFRTILNNKPASEARYERSSLQNVLEAVLKP